MKWEGKINVASARHDLAARVKKKTEILFITIFNIGYCLLFAPLMQSGFNTLYTGLHLADDEEFVSDSTLTTYTYKSCNLA